MKPLNLTLALIISLTFLLSSCKKDNPIIPPVEPSNVIKDTVTISVVGVSFRSIELNVQCSMNNSQYSIRMFRTINSKDTLVAEYPISVRDTTIIDDNNGNGLQLNTEYSYYAVTEDTTGQTKDTSNLIISRTLAATSHNYTWQEYIIPGASGFLSDIWGINADNVWAVGLIYIDGIPYGGIHYNGINWIPDSTFGGYAIFGFSSNDIWAAGGGIFHFDGNKWTDLTERYPVFNNNIEYTSVWGLGNKDVYFSNYWGKVIYWDGNNAYLLNTSNSIILTDVYGLNNNFVLAVGSALAPPNVVLKYDGNKWQPLTGLHVYELYYTIYPITGKEFVIGGEKIVRNIAGVWVPEVEAPNSAIHQIRGNKESGELFAVGSQSKIFHYNGIDWKEMENVSNDILSFSGIAIFQTKVFVVGESISSSDVKILIGEKL